MTVHTLYSGSWVSNCYVLVSPDAEGKNRAAVIDPGCPVEDILNLIASEDAVLDMIVLTHGHFDHILSLDALRDATGAPAYIHKDDAEMLRDGRKNAYSFFFGKDFLQRDAERTLEDGDILTLGSERLSVMHLPGHSKGSIALLGDGIILTGDTVFAQGFGRYDLHGGDAQALQKSLRSLYELDPSLTVYAGHGESARLGQALRSISYFLN